jgi:hypothetical protein
MQDLWNTTKILDLQIMDIEKEEVQAKDIGNIFNKRRAEKFPI